jgi:hypothetical protein
MGESSSDSSALDILSENSNTTILLSCCLHAVILFTILTVLYLQLISKMQGAAFQKVINKSLDDSILPALKNNDPYGLLKAQIKHLPLENIRRYYNRPDPATEAKNEGLKNIMIFGVVFGVVTFFGSCLLLYFSCGKVVPFSFIFVENLLIFAFVGVFEAIFFLNIGKKYVPVPPSFLVNRLYDGIKKM